MRAARRAMLLGAAATLTQAGCSAPDDRTAPPAPTPAPTPSPPSTSPTDSASPAAPDRPRILLAYFSRAGENYYYGDRIDLEVGNTAVLAAMIADRIDCDLHEILAADPYPEDYEPTVERNAREQDADARPGIANDPPDLAAYDVVLLASPIWNVRPPMIMHTFAEALDFTGTTVHPVVTYAVSGLGTAEERYAEACPGATFGPALAVQGEEVRDAGRQVDRWLREAALTS